MLGKQGHSVYFVRFVLNYQNICAISSDQLVCPVSCCYIQTLTGMYYFGQVKNVNIYYFKKSIESMYVENE